MIKKLQKFYKRRSGFSLVELSVVLVIIGSIAASALSVAVSNDYTTKRDETEAKMDRIEEALAGYVAANHRLPCPADGTLAVTNASFGVESVTGSNPQNCNVSLHNNVAAPNRIFFGVVPVRTLQLPDEFMFDGWTRRIFYVVNNTFTNNELTNTNCNASGAASDVCFRDVAAGTIVVNDAAGTERTIAANRPIYLLFSAGENGHGAWIKNGSATRINAFPAGNPYRNATASAAEFGNAEFSNAGAATAVGAAYTTFVMRDPIRIDDGSASDGTSTTRTYFDDQVRYRTKAQVVAAAGGKIYEIVCKTALDLVNGTTTTCSTATDPAQCMAFANEVISRCLP